MPGARRSLGILAAAPMVVAASLAAMAVPASASTMVTTPSCPVAAHRGDHATATENGLAAFTAAAADGVDYLELDVRFSSDQRPVLMHDATVARTTNGTGRVSRLSKATLRSYRLDDGGRIPLLWEALRIAQVSGVGVLVEVKVDGAALGNRRVATQIRLSGASDVVLMSRSPSVLAAVKSLAPEIPQALVSHETLSLAQVAPYPVLAVTRNVATDEWLLAMSGAGKEVLVWVLDEPVDWERFSGRVAAVITDVLVGYVSYRATAPACA